ncbi:ketoacyl-synt-domain-containing protein, partial [Colletotrichum caudatum]
DPSAPIAIVGMGFRGPGDAGNLEGFFKLLSEARETRTEGQNGRWNHEAFYHPDSARKGASNVKAGHYFKDDLSLFDAPFFSMTESEAATLDPQQRLLLETCYEALESAGTSMARIAGSRTSVFVATFGSDYTDLLQHDPDSMPYYQATGSGYSRAIISNRLSHFFDLRGPSVTVDTACSGGLAALHLACQSIRSGETAQAVVGGSSVILHPHQFDSLSAMRFLSPDGRSYSFDDRAEGYARGEGVGCLFLKRLDLAIAEGDPVRAVIRMTASNQASDGGTPGISFPSKTAQVSLIKEAYARAGLDPRDTSYVEAHGTGTGAGDPIETSAIAEAMKKPRGPEDEPLWIGSVKANIGHLEAASGIASVVKCVLMMENKVIFPNRNLVKVNSKIDLEGWRLKIPNSFSPWETKTGIHRLSVNSFGFGGTNVHAILESTEVFLTSRHGAVTWGIDSRYRVFVLSALDEPSLKATARNMAFYLKRQSSQVPTSFLDDLAYTLGFRRSLFPCRSAVSANSFEGLIKAVVNPSRLPLAKINGGKPQPTIGFVFTGQGAQWAGMGKELMDIYPVYAATMRRCRDYLWAIGASWDLIEEIEREAKTSSIARGKFSQPLCSALQISLLELLVSWGIQPAAVTGHSSGEIASAYAAGIISLEDAMTSAYHRGVCSDKVAAMAGNGTAKKGSMMATSLSVNQAEDMISRLESGYATVACHNSPSNVTIAGDADAIVELKEILDREAVFARVLIVEAAYHSRHMEAVRDDYLDSLRGLRTKKGSSNIVFYSSVTGKIAEAAQLGPQYWVDNMMGRVEFASSLEALTLRSKVDILLEVGPHAALAGPVRQILQANERLKAAGIAYASVLKIKESAAKSIAAMAAALTTRGVPVDLHAVHGTTAGTVLTNLPTYPWNRSRSYWAESRRSREFRNCPHPRQDLLGRPEPGFNPLDARWRSLVRTYENPWPRDHRIESRIVYPAAGYIAMAIEAVKQLATRAPPAYRLREVVFGQAMIVPEDDGDDEIEVFINLRARSDGTRKLPTAQSTKTEWREFAIYSVSGDNRWNEHCRGLITAENDKDITKKLHQFPFGMQGIEDSEVTPVNVGQLYETLRRAGLDYGPTFANITGARIGTMPSIARGREEEVDVCLAEVSIPDTASTMPAGFKYPHVLHPAALDAIFHTAFPPIYAAEQDRHAVSREPAVPTFIKSLIVFDR